MDIDAAFDELQRTADADPQQVKEARRRRDLFKDAFAGEDDLAEDVIASGSLARSTQREPINDVDVIIVFDAESHPDWDEPGDSAEEALNYTGKHINALLGATNGTFAKEVRLARPGNHAVKCFFDDPDADDPFTVDAMPALRQPDGTLKVPEKSSQDWISTDPEHLIKLVADKHGRWNLCRPLVRVIKLWKDVRDTDLKSLTAEVLTLDNLPETESTRPRALYRFFNAAEKAIDEPIMDPADLCGEIQPNLDVEKAKAAISDAANTSWEAVNAQDRGDTDRAACLWRSIFGDAFPEPEGGCAADDDAEEEESASGAAAKFGIGTGIGVTQKRPVRDAPQGLTVTDLPRVSWVEAEAERLKHEQEVMKAQCPDMEWAANLAWPSGRSGVGWIGPAQPWSAERTAPAGLDNLLAGRRLRLRALYPEAFPMVAPDLYPEDPDVPLERRTMHKWHVNGDGSLCLMQAADDWQPDDTAADLVCKASGWFIEYLLVEAGHREAMTERGIYLNTELDALIATEYG